MSVSRYFYIFAMMMNSIIFLIVVVFVYFVIKHTELNTQTQQYLLLTNLIQYGVLAYLPYFSLSKVTNIGIFCCFRWYSSLHNINKQCRRSRCRHKYLPISSSTILIVVSSPTSSTSRFITRSSHELALQLQQRSRLRAIERHMRNNDTQRQVRHNRPIDRHTTNLGHTNRATNTIYVKFT